MNELAASITSGNSCAIQEHLLMTTMLTLCSNLCLFCGAFVLHKFQDNIWQSVVLALLLHYCKTLFKKENRSCSSLLEFQSNSLLMSPACIGANRSSKSDSTPVASSSTTDVKILMALLRFLKDLAHCSWVSDFLQNNVAILSYLLPSFLKSQWSDTISSLAADVLVALSKHNFSKVYLVLRSIESEDLQVWNCLSLDISLHAAFMTPDSSRESTGQVGKDLLPDDVLRLYVSDEKMILGVRKILGSMTIDSTCDTNWTTQLKMWAVA